MAYEFAKVTEWAVYKGRPIQKVETPMQEVFTVERDFERAYWSIADCRRAINGSELVYEPVDIRHWFRKPQNGHVESIETNKL